MVISEGDWKPPGVEGGKIRGWDVYEIWQWKIEVEEQKLENDGCLPEVGRNQEGREMEVGCGRLAEEEVGELRKSGEGGFCVTGRVHPHERSHVVCGATNMFAAPQAT